MTNLFSTRYNRTSALGLLLVWVFGLISGVANACLLEDPGVATHQKTPTQFEQHQGKQASVAGHSHTDASPAQTDDAHTSKQPCLKVCDDSSRSLPKKYPIGQVDHGLPMVVAVLWSLVEPAYLPDQQSNSTQRVVPHVPLRHRFSKLAL